MTPILYIISKRWNLILILRRIPSQASERANQRAHLKQGLSETRCNIPSFHDMGALKESCNTWVILVIRSMSGFRASGICPYPREGEVTARAPGQNEAQPTWFPLSDPVQHIPDADQSKWMADKSIIVSHNFHPQPPTGPRGGELGPSWNTATAKLPSSRRPCEGEFHVPSALSLARRDVDSMMACDVCLVPRHLSKLWMLMKEVTISGWFLSKNISSI